MALKMTMEESKMKIDPGTYMVTCFDVKKERLEKSQFGTGDVIRFVLEVDDMVDEDGEPIHLDPIANAKLTPLSKLTGWLAAFDVNAQIGETVDIEQCIGRKAMAVVEERQSEKGGSFPKVSDIIPAPKGKAAPKDVADMEIGDWWKHARELGIERSTLMQAAEDMYGAEPKDLTGAQRAELLEKV